MTIPCNCCVVCEPRCALTEVIFDGAKTPVFSGGPGVVATGPASRWSDGDVAGPNFTGYNSPGVQLTAVTSPIMDLSFAQPHNRVRGLREWNQGGGDLSDTDGFSSWDFEFFAGAVSLATGTMTMGNGGAPFTHLLPGGQELNGVTKVRLSNMRKLNPGATVSPLTREVRALEAGTVFPCRRPNGALEWYDSNGNLALAADIVDCPASEASYTPCETTVTTSFTNGSFELPVVAANTATFLPNASVPGWDCDKGQIELWRTPFQNPGAGGTGIVPYPDGSQLVELAGLLGATVNNLYQTITVPSAAGNIYWSYRHHRLNQPVEEVQLTLGDDTQPLASHTVVSTSLIPSGDNTWHLLSGVWPKPAGVTAVHMRFTQLQGAQGSGNLLDDVRFEMRTPC